MKETNMEHFRGEIEKEEYGVGIFNGAIRNCNKGCGPECDFFGQECGAMRIKWLMSEYKPEPVLTEMEKHFVEFVKEGWIARDEKYNTLYWYSDKPTKDANEWQGEYFTWQLNAQPVISLFPFITWEDEEPWSVEELRKLKVQDAD